jgi:hypothetical protein
MIRERRFCTRILEILGAPYSIREQLGALEGRVTHLLQKLGTKLLFIDLSGLVVIRAAAVKFP